MGEVRCGCGKKLTAEERHYYGHTCEACERRQMGREDEADRQSEVEAATARTLELVAEWFDDLAEHAALAESTEERRQAAIALRSTAFAAWLEDRS